MKNAFYFTLKALFVLKMFKVDSLDFLVTQKNGLIRKIRLISRFITSQPRKQRIPIHILPNISRSKDNQTMKFGQLIEYNIRKTFLEKTYTKCGGETITRYFSKKSILSISLKFYAVCFYCLPSSGLSQYIETKLQITCFYLI